jgi:acetoin utilization deacetylase AcuC-like enzyme
MPIPTLLIYDDRFLAHGVDWHPENAARLEAVSRHLRSRGLWQRMASLPFDAASDEQLAWLHTEEYIEEIRAVCAGGGFEIAPDTPVSQTSFEAAALAAGGCIAAVEAILDGASSTALCLVRPPGHHALPDRGHGFCLFNNAALAAEAALRQGLERMAILDFDLHHGDGTQEMFYHRGDVMYCSVHEHPLFPMTGGLDEVGIDAGTASTVNVPLPAGAGDGHYAEVFGRIFIPVLGKYRPQLIIVSAGYDTHHADPIGHMNMTARGFYDLVAQIAGAASVLCEGKVCIVLEGGYDHDALAAGVENTLSALWGEPGLDAEPAPAVHPQVLRRVDEALRNAVEVHGERLRL